MPEQLSLVTLHSEVAAVALIPELGGRMIELADRRSGRQWLWRNHRVPLVAHPLGADYDSNWVGGFEELFPNDTPSDHLGRAYPDHGELWSHVWSVDDQSEGALTLSAVGPVTGSHLSKTVVVHENAVSVSYRIANTSRGPLPHLFKLHPAIAVDETCRIDMPGGLIEKVDSGFGNLLTGTDRPAWPGPTDLAQCRPASSGAFEFVYVHDSPEGWCGVTDHGAGTRLRIQYPRTVFPYCWLFITYGGWEGHNVVVLEPCTNYPKDLAAAVEQGTAAELPPGEELALEIRIVLEEL